ncbi:MAG: type II secretion system F family protein [Clostridia bacterium]|nr:type II secretion system F family protein [Clostridia bacterium]MBQ6905973.1 type II secretion system F family protein [Clostridia bacterium]
MRTIDLGDLVLSDLFKQLGLLMQSGVMVGDALNIIAEDKTEEGYSKLLNDLSEKVHEGASLSDALKGSGEFSAHVIGLIKTGEQVGRLEETFASLSHYFENKDRRKKKLRDSLTYPCIILSLMVVVIVVLLTQVLPIFNDVYSSLGGKLTGLGGALLIIGNALGAALPYIGIVFGIVLIISCIIVLVPSLKEKFGNLILRMFGDKGVYRKMNDAAFVQSLAVAVGSGIPFEEGVVLASELFSDNPKAKLRCEKCVSLIQEGASFDSALLESGIISKSSAYMLGIGIRAGKGDETILDISNRMADEAEDAINDLLAKIEPSLVISTSLITGVILLTVMLPLIDIMKTIG